MKGSRETEGKIATGLDVGTTKICAIVGREREGRIEISAVGSSPSSGLRKGMVVDMDLTVSSIRQAVQEASKRAGLPVRSACVGIAGGHVRGFGGSGAIAIKGKVVSEGDVERLIAAAGAVYVPVERDVLHVIPGGFRLDGRNGIKNPLGLSGARLEANVHIVTGSVASVESLVTCCRKAGVEVTDIVLEPLASAEAVLSEEEKSRSVILVDIGGGTTDIAFYRDGVLRHTAVLALGGNHITNDIAVGLGVPFGEAEIMKKGYCRDSEPEEKGNSDRSAGSAVLLDEIVGARCEELMMLVKREAETVSGSLAKSTIVLTGGTSLLTGLRELAEEIFGVPVRIGIPEGIIDNGLVRNPIYSTGVGLVRYGLSQSAGTDLKPEGIMERMKKWVNGFFG